MTRQPCHCQNPNWAKFPIPLIARPLDLIDVDNWPFWLRRWRQAQGTGSYRLTLRQLAQELGLSSWRIVARWERGEAWPDAESRRRMRALREGKVK